MSVYLLWYTRVLPDEEESVFLIGVYATQEDAERAKERALPKPGFRDAPEGFSIDEYTLGEDQWTEGFITITHEQLMREQERRDQNLSS